MSPFWRVSNIAFNAYMPVMLAVMEIPGCLVALYLVARLRHRGLNEAGYMPDEPGYIPPVKVGVGPGTAARPPHGQSLETEDKRGIEQELELSMEKLEHPNWEPDRSPALGKPKRMPIFSRDLLQEVFLNPGLVLLIGGILIGLISGLQGQKVVADDDKFFVLAFQGVLCLFLLEMGMTASRKLKDLRAAGPGFIVFGLLAPNIFAPLGIIVAHSYAYLTAHRFQAGNLRAVRGAVRCGVLHRRPGGPAAGDPRGQPNAAAGGITGFDVFVQRHYRDPALYRDQPFDLPLVLIS